MSDLVRLHETLNLNPKPKTGPRPYGAKEKCAGTGMAAAAQAEDATKAAHK